MKRCSRCHVFKPVDQFPWKIRAKGWRQSSCIDCMRTYRMDHYHSNPQPYKDRAVQRRKAVKLQWWKWLSTQSCVDCGEKDPDLLECDHVGEKTMGIRELILKTSSWNRVQEELKKCVVRCVRCHRKKTAHQFGWSRAV